MTSPATARTWYDMYADAAALAITDSGHLIADDGDTWMALALTPREMRGLARELAAMVREGSSYEGSDEWTGAGDELIVGAGRLELVAYDRDEVAGDVELHPDEDEALQLAVMLLDGAEALDS